MTNNQMFSPPRFQVLLRTETPPQVDGITWQVKHGKSFSQEIEVSQGNGDPMAAMGLALKDVQAHLKAGTVPVDVIDKEYAPWNLPPDAECVLVLAEEGGGYTAIGHAAVVCGMHGEKLLPFYAPHGQANKVHAKFTVKKAVVIQVKRDHDAREVSVFKVEVVGMGRVKVEVMWDVLTNAGSLEGWIPNKMLDYKQAILACNGKSNCYHCRHQHYAKIRETGAAVA